MDCTKTTPPPVAIAPQPKSYTSFIPNFYSEPNLKSKTQAELYTILQLMVQENALSGFE